MKNFQQLLELYTKEPLCSLMSMANQVRNRVKGNNKIVTWQIDRNVNITNVCVSGCKFCTFHCRLQEREKGYITSMEEYRTKIEELFKVGGNQILLQGGMHPELGLEYYEKLFSELKCEFPKLRLHALGAPEVYYLSRKAKVSVEECLKRLMNAGLDSLPGAGAEILNTEWRKKYSPAKCSAEDWLSTMEVAQGLGLLSTATMMYGFNDSVELRLEHLLKVRELQSRTGGFSAFIAWPYRGADSGVPDMEEYLRLIAISRIVLDNVENIQASWLSIGIGAGQLALSGGANDMGSIMIEENVISSSGVGGTTLNRERMEMIIREAGYESRLRDQGYNLL